VTERVQLPDPRVVIGGVVDLDLTPTGVTPRRISSAYRFQLPMEVEFLASSPSGVRLSFVTDSASVGLELLATHLALGENIYAGALDLVVDHALVASTPFREGNVVTVDPDRGNFSFAPGHPVTLSFDVPAGAGVLELWLPSNSLVEARALVIDDGATLTAPPVDSRPRWVHHGSSISHCMEAHSGSRTWPATAARIAGVNVTNLGLAGQCHLDQFTARTIRDQPADLLSLKVGINVVNGDTLRQRTFAPALHGFLDTIRDGHPTTPFLVVSPILCPAHEDHAGPSDGSSGTTVALGTKITESQGALTLKQIRGIVAEVVEARRAAGDENLHYLDGRELFNEEDLDDLPDGLHPNGDGYVRMGERFAALAFGPDGPLRS
jgi:hypothetical protein